jgi:hypothetical protein
VTRSSPGQLSFSSGEISPLLAARQDYQRFQSGLAQCNGFIPLRQGGFTRAPGTWFRGNTRADAQSRLIPFVFAADDAVVLEFSSGKMRVWRYGTLIESGGSPYELSHSWTWADIQKLQWVQSADVIYFATGTGPIRKLSRLALSNWTLTDVSFRLGPFRLQNLDRDMTIKPSAQTGTGISVTGTGGPFSADMVGSLIRLEPEDGGDVPLWTGNRAVSVGDRVRYRENTYSLQAGSNTGANPPIHTEGDYVYDAVDGTEWRYLDNGVGIIRVVSYIGPNSITANVITRIPLPIVDDGTYRWSPAAWSEKYGYPSAIEIYDQRLVAAGTPTDPRTLWFSTLGDFEDFEPSVDPDGSFAYAIAGKSSVNRILWLAAGKNGLHVGALGEEYSTRSVDGSVVIGPTTTKFDLDSSIGSAAQQPTSPDGNPIFISRDGTRIFELAYAFESNGAVPRELSLPAEHLGQTGFLDMAWQSAPLRLCWVRQTNGNLAVMVHDPAEDILGWARHQVAGFVESICVTPGNAGGADRVMMVVRRTIDGETRRHVEEFASIFGIQADSEPAGDANHLMCAVRFVTPEQQQIFYVPHLVGRTVYAWTSEGDIGPLTVGALGIVNLGRPVAKCIIGIFATGHVVQTLDIPAPARDGMSLGRKKRLHPGTGIALHKTAGGWVRSVSFEFGRDVVEGKQEPLLPVPLNPLTASAYTGNIQSEIATEAVPNVAIQFSPDGGRPLTVLAIVPRIEETGS